MALVYIISDSLDLGIKYFLFSEVLLLASYFDIRTRIIPNWIHVLIIMIGCIGFDPVRSTLGLILTVLPFLIMVMMIEGSIGGGDVKLVGACGFVLGFDMCMFLVICANVFAICFALLYYLNIKGIGRMRLPFVPFLFLGWVVIMVIKVG